MKTLNRLNDGTWEQVNLVPMSDETKAILLDDNASEEQKFNAIQAFKSESTKVADAEDAAVAETLFNENSMANHVFISALVWLPSKQGLINCRNPENLEHCQIRF